MLTTSNNRRQSMLIALLGLACLFSLGMTFVPVSIPSKTHVHVQSRTTSSLFVFGKKSTVGSVKPAFDKATETWQKSAADDGQYPYDAVGALLRHGPAPFLKRITDPKGYEQSVLQYMAATGCSRAEATGNMDAKLNNAADWAYQKLEEKKTGKKVDYTVLDAKDAALTIIWALGITPLVLYSIAQTASQFGTGPSVIKY
ncbi:hypothetical protein IV203_024139 [Nitzschia inconspicua]|uniref:Uncharacterized protein n=1 Tax=Nitzschia inconspicua TaxID=303405 RepID=A0A9K3KC11_9STRA|nr:hypothetical protein IV203_024139 [Nitzschia inconspicua]